MKKTFNFGKIDYWETGIHVNLVTVTVKLQEKENGQKVFSVCGNIWNSNKTDIVCGGQCLDTIAEYIKTPLFKEIYRLWKTYHLNDMHSECEHQRSAGWLELANKKVTLFKYSLDEEAAKKQRDAKKAAEVALINGETFIPTKDQSFYAALPYFLDLYETPEPPEHYKKYKSCTGSGHTEIISLRWVRNEEYEEGLLSKPCPVCGYKYGNARLYEKIPSEDMKKIQDLLAKQ